MYKISRLTLLRHNRLLVGYNFNYEQRCLCEYIGSKVKRRNVWERKYSVLGETVDAKVNEDVSKETELDREENEDMNIWDTDPYVNPLRFVYGVIKRKKKSPENKELERLIRDLKWSAFVKPFVANGVSGPITDDLEISNDYFDPSTIAPSTLSAWKASIEAKTPRDAIYEMRYTGWSAWTLLNLVNRDNYNNRTDAYLAVMITGFYYKQLDVSVQWKILLRLLELVKQQKIRIEPELCQLYLENSKPELITNDKIVGILRALSDNQDVSKVSRFILSEARARKIPFDPSPLNFIDRDPLSFTDSLPNDKNKEDVPHLLDQTSNESSVGSKDTVQTPEESLKESLSSKIIDKTIEDIDITAFNDSELSDADSVLSIVSSQQIKAYPEKFQQILDLGISKGLKVSYELKTAYLESLLLSQRGEEALMLLFHEENDVWPEHSHDWKSRPAPWNMMMKHLFNTIHDKHVKVEKNHHLAAYETRSIWLSYKTMRDKQVEPDSETMHIMCQAARVAGQYTWQHGRPAYYTAMNEWRKWVVPSDNMYAPYMYTCINPNTETWCEYMKLLERWGDWQEVINAVEQYTTLVNESPSNTIPLLSAASSLYGYYGDVDRLEYAITCVEKKWPGNWPLDSEILEYRRSIAEQGWL